MAYSPFDQARLLHDQRLIGFARANDMTPAQVALAWLISHDDVIAIPRTGTRHRLQENARALDVRLTPDQLAELDVLFPPPSHPNPLEML